MSEPNDDKTIGSLNGPWAILLRIMLGTYPFVMMWAIWVSKSLFELHAFAGSGARFSLQDAYSMERRLEEKFETEYRMLSSTLREFENEFTRDFVRKDELSNKQ